MPLKIDLSRCVLVEDHDAWVLLRTPWRELVRANRGDGGELALVREVARTQVLPFPNMGAPIINKHDFHNAQAARVDAVLNMKKGLRDALRAVRRAPNENRLP